ncbi:hypothetical protein BH18ACT9_BH18ACT9_20980 [soil metagenome]
MSEVLLVDPSAGESHALARLGCLTASGTDLDDRVVHVDAVVVGSQALAPLRVVQQVHRAAPWAGVVVCTTPENDADLRRRLSYAPDIPSSVRVVPALAPDLAQLVTEVAEAASGHRRHQTVLAAVAARAVTPTPHSLVPASLGPLLDHAPFGVLVAEVDERLVTWNPRAETMLDLPTSAVGQRVSSLFSDPDPLVHAFTLARSGLLDGATSPHTVNPAGIPLEVTAVPTRLDNGRSAVVVLLQDVSDRSKAERSRDRLAAQVGLLSGVSEALAGTLDGDEAFRRLAREVVPTLGDWVALQTYDHRGLPRRVAVHHRDERLSELAERTALELPPTLSEDNPGRRIAEGEGHVLVPRVTSEQLDSMIADTDVRALVDRMGAASLLAVPLPAREGVLGSMVLVNGPGSEPFGEQDVAIAVEVGRRAGVALETVGLYAEQRDLAAGLQRSLLSEPVEPDHGEIVVRYVAAAEVAQVGGDWYDSFIQGDGATVLVIGDVVGHDTQAAAAMGQLRGLLRGIGYTTGTGPAEMLSRLDNAIEGLLISTTATVIVARVEQEPALRDAGLTRLRWSNAGHPPPVLLTEHGPATLLEGPSSNVLLGVMRDAKRDEHDLLLERDATVLLYTDGLVERRGEDIDTGIARLLATVEELRHLPLVELCDELLDRMLPAGHDDDVALAAIRLHTQDEPRPAEAGPARIPESVPADVPVDE